MKKQIEKINRQFTERRVDTQTEKQTGRQITRQDYIRVQSDNKDFFKHILIEVLGGCVSI